MAKKIEKKSGGGGGANWMDTYGDLVTLLLTFFVMLFAFSSVDAGKWDNFVKTMAGAPFIVSSPLDGGFSDFPVIRWEESEGEATEEPDDTSSSALLQAQAEINEQFDKLYRQIESYIDANGLSGSMVAHRDGDIITIRFRDKMLFDSGKAVLKPDSLEAIARVKTLLWEQQDSYASIRIEGHTDTVPIKTGQYPSNWYLSSARAMAVLDCFLVDDTMSIEPVKLSSVGLSEYHPIADNETDEGRAQNRRVDIVIERRNIQ